MYHKSAARYAFLTILYSKSAAQYALFTSLQYCTTGLLHIRIPHNTLPRISCTIGQHLITIHQLCKHVNLTPFITEHLLTGVFFNELSV